VQNNETNVIWYWFHVIFVLLKSERKRNSELFIKVHFFTSVFVGLTLACLDWFAFAIVIEFVVYFLVVFLVQLKVMNFVEWILIAAIVYVSGYLHVTEGQIKRSF
jgi:hypothetical protein